MNIGTSIVGMAVAPAGCRASPPTGSILVALPDGRPGIGFDDLRFSRTYGVLAPGGRSGNLDLIDPATRAVTAIGGFSMEVLHFAGHDQGATSVDEGGGFLFVSDRTTQKLLVVDALLQAAGASLFVVGFVKRRTMRVSVAPTARGLVIGGHF